MLFCSSNDGSAFPGSVNPERHTTRLPTLSRLAHTFSSHNIGRKHELSAEGCRSFLDQHGLQVKQWAA